MHTLQSRRAISVVICDNNRVTAKCYGTVVCSTKFNQTPSKEEDMPSTSNTRDQFAKTKKHKDMKCKGVNTKGYKLKNHKFPYSWDLLVSKWGDEQCWSVKTLTDAH